MKFNFGWKSIVGIVLIGASVVLGVFTSTPILVMTSIVGIVAGAVLAITEQIKKTDLKGWHLAVYLIGLIGGTSLLTFSGYTEGVICEVVGAIVLLVSIIFGIAVDKTKKVEEKKD